MWSRRRSCGARPWPWSAPPAPARPSPSCASPTWPGVLGRKVCFVDCKGTDPTLVPALIAAYRLGNPSARVGCWPRARPWTCGAAPPPRCQSRLLAVEQFTEPFYQRVASAGLRLALTAPDMPPVEGSDELLRRLDVDELAALWEGRPAPAQGHRGHRRPPPRRPAALRRLLRRPGRRLRPRPLELRGRRPGRPHRPHPAVQERGGCGHAGGAGGLRPLRHRPQAPRGRGRPARPGRVLAPSPPASTRAINLAERVRDVGVQVVVAAQIGRRPRRPPPGAPAAGLAAPAGSSSTSARTPSGCWPWPGWSGSWSTTGSWTTTAPAGSPRPAWGTGPGSTPRQVRQAQPGEAWVIQAGQSIHLRVLPPPAVAPEPVELTATLPLADDTMPAAGGRGAGPVGIAAAVALAGRMVRRAGQRMGRRRERAGRLPSPARRPWLVGRPLPGRGRR